jgi:uncharacterized protein (DUF1778 family)
LIARRSSRWEKRVELLSLQDQARDVFVHAVSNPPAPNKAARNAAQRFKDTNLSARDKS